MELLAEQYNKCYESFILGRSFWLGRLLFLGRSFLLGRSFVLVGLVIRTFGLFALIGSSVCHSFLLGRSFVIRSYWVVCLSFVLIGSSVCRSFLLALFPEELEQENAWAEAGVHRMLLSCVHVECIRFRTCAV